MKGMKSMKVGDRRVLHRLRAPAKAVPPGTRRKRTRFGTIAVHRKGTEGLTNRHGARGGRQVVSGIPMPPGGTGGLTADFRSTTNPRRPQLVPGVANVGCRRSKLEVRLHVSEERNRNCPPLTPEGYPGLLAHLTGGKRRELRFCPEDREKGEADWKRKPRMTWI
jgi:hypothetical protein